MLLNDYKNIIDSIKKIIIVVFLLLPTAAMVSCADDSYSGYPDPQAMYDEIYALQKQYPGAAQVEEYGKSVRGRPLLYIKISTPGTATDSEKAQAMVAANIHGNEWIGNRTAMAVARRLLEGKDKDPWIKSLLEKMDFYILPCLNPDGYWKTWENRNNDKAEWPEMRKNAHGVDINRNFPLPGKRTVNISLAGSTDPASERYTGPSPYSEPESAAIRDFVASRRIFAAIDFHSNWGTFFPPKCNGSACEKQFRKMMDAASEKQTVKYPTVQGWQVDSFSGEMEDTLFYQYGIMAVCWEIFPQAQTQEQEKKKHLSHPFWEMNPEDVSFWTHNETDATLAALESAYQITGGRPVPEKARQVKE